MLCPHDVADREVAVADGMCPLCLANDNERLRAALQQIKELETLEDGKLSTSGEIALSSLKPI